MNRITLFPRDAAAQINTVLASNVDFTGIDPTIHCIQWYGDLGQGTIEYVDDPITGAKPQNDVITDIAPYMSYAEQAVAIINIAENPEVYYATSNGVLFGDVTYALGTMIEIGTLNTLPPPQSTQQVPPTPEDFQELWWYDDAAWVVSPFNPALTLTDAKNFLIEKVQVSGGEQADYQARIYSAYSLVASGDPGALPTADYYGIDLATYQTYIDGEIATMTATINAATNTAQLYSFDWRVEGNPNN